MIHVLAVDDSALMRKLLRQIFEAEDGFQLAIARDGLEGLAMLHSVKPDVVILDVNMPNMDGLACLDRIMLERPSPVVMFSTLTEAGAKDTLEALELGAVDFVPKPAGTLSLKVDEFGPVLVEKVRMAAGARLASSHRLAERVRLRTGGAASGPRPRRSPRPPKPLKRTAGAARPDGERLVLVGSSTGGPPALDALLEPLPADFPWPVVVAQHMPASFTGALAARMDRNCALAVSEVARPVELKAGHVYVGRGDADVIVSRRSGGLIALSVPSSREHPWHPSVDRLVDSAMEAVTPDLLVGVLMTGMGVDGAAAMTRLRAEGGRTIAEAEETAVVWGMPAELARRGGAEFVEPVDRIADRLLALATSS
jgi:two-component system chemotaxis response regulator CheB